MKTLKDRGRKAIIYHFFNVSINDASLNVQLKTDSINGSNLIIMLRHDKMPTLDKCDMVKAAQDIAEFDGIVLSRKYHYNY